MNEGRPAAITRRWPVADSLQSADGGMRLLPRHGLSPAGQTAQAISDLTTASGSKGGLSDADRAKATEQRAARLPGGGARK